MEWVQVIENKVSSLPSWISVPLMVGSGLLMLGIVVVVLVGGAGYLVWQGYNILADLGAVFPLP